MTNSRFYLVIAAMIIIFNSCLSKNMVSYAAVPEPVFCFSTGSARISAGDEWNKVHKVLGKEKASKISAAHNDEGKIVTYIFDSCEIKTLKNLMQQTYIEEIALKEGAKTEEGLRIGQNEKEVMILYPQAVQKAGYYVVEKGNSELVIGCHPEEGVVVSIKYRNKHS